MCTRLFWAAEIEKSFGGCSGVKARKAQPAFELPDCTDTSFCFWSESHQQRAPAHRQPHLSCKTGVRSRLHSAASGHPLKHCGATAFAVCALTLPQLISLPRWHRQFYLKESQSKERKQNVISSHAVLTGTKVNLLWRLYHNTFCFSPPRTLFLETAEA